MGQGLSLHGNFHFAIAEGKWKFICESTYKTGIRCAPWTYFLTHYFVKIGQDIHVCILTIQSFVKVNRDDRYQFYLYIVKNFCPILIMFLVPPWNFHVWCLKMYTKCKQNLEIPKYQSAKIKLYKFLKMQTHGKKSLYLIPCDTLNLLKVVKDCVVDIRVACCKNAFCKIFIIVIPHAHTETGPVLFLLALEVKITENYFVSLYEKSRARMIPVTNKFWPIWPTCLTRCTGNK